MPLQLGEVLLLLLVLHSSMSENSFPDTQQEHVVRSHRDFSVVHPEKVDADGHFISHTLSHQFASGRRQRREADDRESERVYYRLTFSGRDLTLNLTVNNNLLSHGYVLERRTESGTETGPEAHTGNPCHLIGTVTDGDAQGSAALSSCNGLTGMLSLPSGVFLIEPVRGHTPTLTHPQQPHVIYRNSEWLSVRSRRSTQRDVHTACGVKDSPEHSKQTEHERERWEREQQGPDRGRSRRSVSTERWVETMVVADSKMLQYHGNNNVESYIFTVMNMVAGMYHDASIGNAIHIVLVRLILLQSEEKGLKVVHHADSTLTSFCSWQKNLNPQSDAHPAHHDVAVLITRKDICAGKNQPCETLGLSHLSGMCQPHRSCNINEDSGLPVAFTIAHELGHSFGIQHDGQGNDCELVGRAPFIMSRQLQYDSSPLTWSTCSKQYITHFLDRGWGFCLDDRPSRRDMMAALVAPGLRYTRQHQCQMQYGPRPHCVQKPDNVCQILWCSVDGACRSKLDAPIDGTRPAFGGKYCTGERKRYRMCNTLACVKKKPSFRDMQCSEFDTVPYHNQLYQWIPITRHSHPCELHCRPVDEGFSERMLDAVTDGTPCFSNSSRSICINVERESQVGGVRFYYERSGNLENLTSPGPTTEPIIVQNVAGEERVLHPGGCRKLPKPKAALACNRNMTCGSAWAVGKWSECSLTCGGGVKSRSIKCITEPQTRCDPMTRPRSTTFCNLQSCSRTRPNPSTPTPAHDPDDLTSAPTPSPYTPTCSTSCGLGAVWRSVVCSSGQDSDCSSTARPEPAQHCNLQPCAVWRKCVEGCVSGMKYKDVQCVDSQSGRVLRPFHCTDQPSPSTVQWKHTRWGQCSKSCGGGVQKRVIRCVSEGSGEEVKSSLCLKDDKPESLRSCGEEECRAERVCKRDSMSTRFCSTLKLLGHCVLSSVRKQCCLTCVM
ncbi:hypothetical protein QTP70_029197 [Hemibagrus guttatus]|uniref:Uncharacterized protein n=1 Tax=Hemibagrus guttatus TaxID=175788 RepID=A0AAE0URD1_9TELE|nr:hypothetical protein QTP70_029197 [Hemibagrus guttatus]